VLISALLAASWTCTTGSSQVSSSAGRDAHLGRCGIEIVGWSATHTTDAASLPAAAHCSQTALGEHEGAWLRLAWPSGADVVRAVLARLDRHHFRRLDERSGAQRRRHVRQLPGRQAGHRRRHRHPRHAGQRLPAGQRAAGRDRVAENTIDGHVGKFWYGSVFNASGAAREYKVFALCAFRPTL
jgi:hypothetical protein